MEFNGEPRWNTAERFWWGKEEQGSGLRFHRQREAKLSGLCNDDMAVFSKELCEKKLKTWLAAEESIATGQSYQIGNRMLTRADLKQVREEMEYWAGKLAEAEKEDRTGGRNRSYRAVFRDL